MKTPFIVLCAAISLSACAILAPAPNTSIGADAGLRPVARPDGGSVQPDHGAVTVEQFDTTTPQQRAEAVSQNASPASERELGRTVASLGNPADPGFWLETALIDESLSGRVFAPETGNSVTVELRPIAGPPTTGSRISLAAMRLLGVQLTSLPELVVFAGK